MLRHAILLAVVTPLAAQPAPPILEGVVTSGGKPVPRAEVGVVDGVRRALTGPDGRYRIADIGPGRYPVFARAIGYRPVTSSVNVSGDSVTRLDFELQPEALALPDLKVEARFAKPARLAHTTRYDDFYRRRRAGFGTFLTRDDIDAATALRTFELLRGIPGIKVAWNPPGVPGTEVRFARCPNFPPKISIWIDGNRQHYFVRDPGGAAVMPGGGRSVALDSQVQAKAEAYRSWLELLDGVRPGEIEAMEIFRGVGQIPAEFLDDSCAAVVIWTREGGRQAR